VGDEVVRHAQDRRTTHGQISQMFESMGAELARLRGETGTLVSALKRPQVRGAWGEMQLRNCVAAANMIEHVDFVSQVTVSDSDGSRLRPDLVVHLPAERDVVVDAKVPMDAYLRALECSDEAEQQELLRQHGRQARQHIDALASKSYHAQFEGSPEFVVMFIPNEGVWCAALEAEPTLLEHGAAKGVLIATPTTLIALLHATYYGWRQEKIAESAREIAAAGRELHKRIATFLEPYAKLGRQINSVVNAYNQGAGSLDARVLPQLRRLEEAGAESEKTVTQLAGLDTPATSPHPRPRTIPAGLRPRRWRATGCSSRSLSGRSTTCVHLWLHACLQTRGPSTRRTCIRSPVIAPRMDTRELHISCLHVSWVVSGWRGRAGSFRSRARLRVRCGWRCGRRSGTTPRSRNRRA
jgi:DNA anti-recombination protein RmuC